MDARATSRISRVLLTGPPGIGKTTVCKKLASMLEKQSYKYDGFYTEEIRGRNNTRIGFDVVALQQSGKRSPLARTENILNSPQHSKYRVGNYHVFLNEFEAAALPVFDSNADVLLIDEIGKMELFSKRFEEKVLKLFFETSKRMCIIATIPQMHKVPQRHLSLFQKLHADEKSKIISVNRENRDTLPEEIFKLVTRGVQQ